MTEDLKSQMMKLHRSDLLDSVVVPIVKTLNDSAAHQEPICGFVMWEENPPSDTSYLHHKLTFIDAIETALSFVQTNCMDEWIVAGPRLLAIVRTLPGYQDFKEVRSLAEGLYRVGMFRTKVVYAWPIQQDVHIGYVGCGSKCSKIAIKL
jgi:hypothetical protein